MRIRLSRALTTTAALVLSVSAASCGGGSGGSGDLVLVSFNLPNIAGVALNQPLIYTFSDNVDPTSVTPDTLQVVGSPSFTFETIVVDGNLVAELPFIPNFEDYSDSGLAPATTYSVFLPIFPAVDTVRSATGRPLVKAESFSFTTSPIVTFIEPRRPITHAPGPFDTPPGKGDNDGCINNPDNSLYVYPGIQFASGPDARLLCLKNEGPPHVIPDECSPTMDQRAVGTPSATAPGTIDMPAIRVRVNEPLDPISVVPYVPTTQLSLNVQLWFVGDSQANAAPPVQVKTNKPLVVQDLNQTEVILVAVGPQPQGTYLINVQGVKDLPGNLVVVTDAPDPVPGGYGPINSGLAGLVPPGYRIYFRTLQLPTTPGSVTESFGNNVSERTTDVFTRTNTGTQNPVEAIPSSPADAVPSAGFTLIQTEPGQSTTANWNGAYTFLGIPGATVNTNIDDGSGRLKAVFEPYLGNGDDGNFNLTSGSATLSSAGADFNGDGIFEFETFNLGAGAVLNLIGTKPVLILVRGACTIDGAIHADGKPGGFGIDTDGTVKYTNTNAIFDSGDGGVGGPGGGNGGKGGPKGGASFAGDAEIGHGGVNLYGEVFSAGGGGVGAFGDLQNATPANQNKGGGGGGYGTAGSGGSGAANGLAYGQADFTRALGSFSPQRAFQPSANFAGGSGGGGGGIDDDAGTSETGNGTVTATAAGRLADGDDGGGGGGGGGGGLWIIAKSISVGATGVITANGGKGGNTYGPSDQVVVDPDPQTANDEYVAGVVNDQAAGTGHGGAGGGGSGGAILLEARDSLTVAAGASMSCVGGSGGTASVKNGGDGGLGRIAFIGFKATTEAAVATMNVSGAATLNPIPGINGATWAPTVDMTSQGVSNWIDMVTATATFATPFWTSNFGFLTGAGLVQGPPPTGDFNAILEFQGADTLTPNSTNPTGATGLTAWVSTVSTLNGKLLVRWRWRFFVNRTDSNSANNPDFDPSVYQMPAILDFTLPFSK